jgi:peptidoglycan/LPS O-acetylase OafA/YrhL
MVRAGAHIPALDGVRACAILIVLAFHTLPDIPFGWAGVILFFVLSGFLITGILLDAQGCPAWEYFSVFYTRRSLRIFPIYYVTLATAVALAFAFSWPLADWPYYAVYLQNFVIDWQWHPQQFPGFMSHTWSLAVEEQFYLCWPVLVFVLSRRSLSLLCTSLLLLAPLFRAWVARAFPETFFYYTLLPSHVDSLAAGALLALIVRRWPACRITPWYCAYAAGSAVALAVLVGRFSDSLLRLLLPYLFANALLFPLLCPMSWPARVLTYRPVRYIGRISYGLYLFHPFVYHCTHAVARRVGLPAAVTTVFELTILGVTATFSWRLFESRLNGLKRHFNYRSRRISVREASVSLDLTETGYRKVVR